MTSARGVALREARSSDVAHLERWDEEPAVIAATGAEGDDDEAYDWAGEISRALVWRDILIAEWKGRPVGVVIVIDAAEEETHYWGDIEPGTAALDIWIGEPEARGHGVGSAMMRAALARWFDERGARRAVIDPLLTNRDAIRFYRRLGFVEKGPRLFGGDHCLVMEMTREAWRDREADIAGERAPS